MLLQLFFIASLVLVHAFAGKLVNLQAIPRSAWLSFAGGVSVAYVFIHIFPELTEAQQTIDEHGAISYIEHHAYLVALVGLAVFYGLEHMVKSPLNAERHQGGHKSESQPIAAFWLHIGSFSLYNALIGYLLVDQEQSPLQMVFYTLAMGFHFLVNDHALLQHHRHVYLHQGRWILSAAVLFGWVCGQLVEVSEAATSTLFAFLAGGIVLNILKEELPEERQSRFWPFAFGTAGYSAFLLVL
ncbi:hypothetical protein R5M92_02995 [Halomonas sp. Bachu 37]|uniref:hypothetical protein n=1 Tax=Halomonas kashgarensis TaxID=3084920 RepID=UPI003216D3B9